jgi:hypothetical protein
MKVYYNTWHFKNVPKKFEPIKDTIPDLMLYEECKRLHSSERDILEMALLKYYYSSFIEKLKDEQPLVFEYLKDGDPEKFERVERRNGDTEYVIIFNNNKRVRASRSDFPGVVFGNGYLW